MNRTYTTAERTEAVALALAVGPVKAAKQLNIPRRTVAYWCAGHGPSPVAIIREQTRDEIARKLWDGVSRALDAVIAGLDDPKARLSDKAHALQVLSERHALLSGGVTARTESANLNVSGGYFTDEEARGFRDWLARIGEEHPDILAAAQAELDERER